MSATKRLMFEQWDDDDRQELIEHVREALDTIINGGDVDYSDLAREAMRRIAERVVNGELPELRRCVREFLAANWHPVSEGRDLPDGSELAD